MSQAKREAARAALALLPERGVVGLGSGSTAELFIEEVGRLVAAGRELVGVPTSEASRKQAAAHQIEQVGSELRAMMPWIGKNKLVDKAKN